VRLRPATAIVALVLAISTVVVVTQASTSSSRFGTPTPDNPERVGCAKAALGEADPKWRRRSTSAWNLGLYGPGRDFRTAQRDRNQALVVKLPVIIGGVQSYTVVVPEGEIGNVGLAYGFSQARRVRQADTALTFRPCATRRNTGWPGGLLLKDRDPVQLEVLDQSGQATTLRIGRLPGGGPARALATSWADVLDGH
jgi:hypothetical protein